MPSAAAPRMSPCSARRLRSRQVIWKIGSMPLCPRECAMGGLEGGALGPAAAVAFGAGAVGEVDGARQAFQRHRAPQELRRVGGARRRNLRRDDKLPATQ